MAKSWSHRKSCRCCNSRQVRPVAVMGTVPARGYSDPELTRKLTSPEAPVPVTLSHCATCQHLQLLDVIKPGGLPPLRACPPASEQQRTFFRDLARDVVRHGDLAKGALVVDIGCGNGALAGALSELGMKVIGVDPSPDSASLCKKAGIPHYAEEFTGSVAATILKEHGPAAAITATFILGTTDNLHAIASGVRHLLARNGLFHIVEPSALHLNGHVLPGLVHHDRVSLFTTTAVASFFPSVLLELIHARTLDQPAAIWHGVIQHQGGPRPPDSSIAALIQQEKSRGTLSQPALSAMESEMQQTLATLRQQVKAYIDRGQKVAVFGTLPAALSLIHACGWTKETIAGVIDPMGRTLLAHDIGFPLVAWADAGKDGIRAVVAAGHPLFDGWNPDQLAAYRQAGGMVIHPGC